MDRSHDHPFFGLHMLARQDQHGGKGVDRSRPLNRFPSRVDTKDCRRCLEAGTVLDMPLVAVDPYFDALHLGGLAAVLAGSAVLYWLVTLLLSRRARHLTPALATVLLGAIAVNAGYFLPWARVESRHFSLTLFGSDFGGAFGAGVLAAIAVAVFLGAALSPVWESSALQVGLGAVLVGGGVGAGLLATQYLRPEHSQIVAAFTEHGPAALASTRHIALAQANDVIDRLVSSGALRVAHSFGPYVVVGGALVATAAGVLNFMHQVRGTFAGRGRRRWPAAGEAEGGPLARGRGASTRVPPPRGRAPRAPSKPKPSPKPVRSKAGPVAPVSAHRMVVDDVPPAPPMPGRGVPPTGSGRAQLDSKWAASPSSSHGSRRNRAR
jgi:hypothetical protein